FKSADKIALNLGLARDSDERLRAGLTHVLFEATEDGHCFLPLQDLIERARETLEIDDNDRFLRLIEMMTASKEFYRVGVETLGDVIYVAPLFLAERAAAMRLLNFNHAVAVDRSRVIGWLERFCERERLELSGEQRSAIVIAVSNGASIITGGPGCGKTTA